jgi:N-acetylmuramoyl-L-alanine amidase
VLRDAAMPAILVESGYMTHPAEGRRILDAGYRKMIAAAIVAGILNYQKLNGPKPESFTTRTPKTAPVKFSKQHI